MESTSGPLCNCDMQFDSTPRPVIVNLLSHKSKMKVLLKPMMLKDKGLVIVEDMADDFS